MSGSLHLDTRRHGFIPKPLLLPDPKHPPSVVFLSFAPGLLMFIMRIITMKCTIWLSWLDLLALTTSWVTRALREPQYHDIIIKGWTFHDIQLWLLFPFSIWKIGSSSWRIHSHAVDLRARVFMGPRIPKLSPNTQDL